MDGAAAAFLASRAPALAPGSGGSWAAAAPRPRLASAGASVAGAARGTLVAAAPELANPLAAVLALASSLLLAPRLAAPRPTSRRRWRRAVRGGQPRTVGLAAIVGAQAEAGADRAEATTSPFDPEAADGELPEKPFLPLTWDNVELVLDEVRPYLRMDGGDCRLVAIDGPMVRVELEGSCSSCSASSVTLKMGIERTLRERIPDVTEVVAVAPGQEPLTEAALLEVLDDIRPFLAASGGNVALQEWQHGDNLHPRVVLSMTGPPVKSMAVRVEVVNRMRRRFPLLQNVEIVPAVGAAAV